MLRQSLHLPGLLALSLYSSSATTQYTNSSVGPDFDIPHTVLRRLSLSDAGLTLRDIYESDQARVGWLYESAIGREDDPSNPTAGFLNTRADQSDDIKVDNAVCMYVAHVGVGTPPTTYTLIVDTGSANTWISDPTKGGMPYARTKTSHGTGNRVGVKYASGYFKGNEFLDDLTLGKGLRAEQQSIGVAYQHRGYNYWDGILGLGPTDLTQGTTQGRHEVPTVTDTLFMQHKVDNLAFGLWFTPAHPSRNSPGEISWGKPNTSKFTGKLHFVHITSKRHANQYWAVDSAVSYGGKPLLPSTAAMLDSGTTLLLLSTEAYLNYKRMVGAEEDPKTGLLCLPEGGYQRLKDLDFTIAGLPGKLTLTPNAQIWPRKLNGVVGGSSECTYLVVGNAHRKQDAGFNVILGHVFLERYYTYYDGRNHRIGFATTKSTYAEAN